jgi:hypothetical protein
MMTRKRCSSRKQRKQQQRWKLIESDGVAAGSTGGAAREALVTSLRPPKPRPMRRQCSLGLASPGRSWLVLFGPGWCWPWSAAAARCTGFCWPTLHHGHSPVDGLTMTLPLIKASERFSSVNLTSKPNPPLIRMAVFESRWTRAAVLLTASARHAIVHHPLIGCQRTPA